MARHSLETPKARPSADNWSHSPDPNAAELQSPPRLSVNAWRNSTSIDSIRRVPSASSNPFKDPTNHSEADTDPINHPSVAHTHQDHIEHQDTHPVIWNSVSDIEAEAAQQLPKNLTPSITALPINLPYHTPPTQYPQRTHHIFLTIRLLLQVLLFVLALIGYLLAYPRVITYSGMLTGNSLGFVITWAAVLILAYFGDKGLRMSRWSNEREQWGKMAKMVVIDVVIVGVWLLVCWGNTAFAKGVMEEAAKNAANPATPAGGKNADVGGRPKFTPTGVIGVKPTGR